MTVEELSARFTAGNPPLLLDVREPHELSIASFSLELVNIPLGQIPQRFTELPKDAEIVCACRSGARSAQAVQFLRARGYTAVNLEGGILAWSDRIDPTVPRY